MNARLVEALSRRGDAAFLRFEDGSARSGDELQSRADAIAGLLSSRGVQQGDVVALRHLSVEDTVCALFGVWRLGAVAFPLSHREPEAVVQQVLANARACAQLVGSTNDVSVTVVERRFELPQIVTLLRTSGSSGAPKIAAHTQANHIVAAATANAAVAFEPGDAWLLSLPLFHVGGLSILTRAAIGDGVVAVPQDGLTTRAFETLRPTHLSAVTTQLARFVDDNGVEGLRGLKSVLLGGSAIPRDLRDLRDHGVRLFTSYGSTESTAMLAASAEPDVVNAPDAAGVVLPDRTVEVAPDGEIRIGGPTLFAGYLTRDGLQDPRGADGLFGTGDMGYVDDRGVLFVRGRRDRMFVSGGENIHPEEIESALESLPSVERAVVVSVPNDQYGQRPEAFVRLEAPATGDALRAQLREHLPGFKLPDRLWRMPDGDVEPRHLEQLVEESERLTPL